MSEEARVKYGELFGEGWRLVVYHCDGVGVVPVCWVLRRDKSPIVTEMGARVLGVDEVEWVGESVKQSIREFYYFLKEAGSKHP